MLFSGALLVAVMAALLFNKSVRADLLGGQAEVSFWKAVKVKGAFILGLILILCVGVVFPIVFSLPVGDPPDGPRRVVVASPLPPNIPALVEAVARDSPDALAIRRLQQQMQGPWARPNASRYAISVPVDIAPSVVRGCPEHFEKMITFFLLDGVTVESAVNGILFSAPNCAELSRVDFQVGCGVARQLFPRRIDQCFREDGDRWPRPRWIEPPGSEPLEVIASLE